MPRLEWFGVNIGHDPVYDPKLIAKAGFNAIRIVAQPHIDLREYNKRCHAEGVKVKACFPSESFNRWPGPTKIPYPEAADFYVTHYAAGTDGDFDVWGLGNECDGTDGVNKESSVLPADQFNALADAFLDRLPSAANVYAIGTVTGDPKRLAGYDLSRFDGLDNHAYAQWPNTVNAMLAGYNQYDAQFGLKTRIVSEFGWPSPDAAQRGQYIRDMARVFENNPKVRGVWVYCWELSQHQEPFGLTTGGGTKFTAAIPYIQELGYSPTAGSIPVPAPIPHFEFILGIKAKADELRARGVDVGEPLMPETYPWEGAKWSYQRTSRGKFEYDSTTNTVQFFSAQ